MDEPRRNPPSRQPFTRASLVRLLSNALYTGTVLNKGERYQGEHAAIISQELWQRVQQQLCLASKYAARRTRARTDALLGTVLRCQTCASSMRAVSARRHGRVYRYYICSRQTAVCSGIRVAAADIEASVLRHLAPILGTELSRPLLEQAIEQISYEATSRRVAMVFRDGTGSEYVMPEPTRTGVWRWRAEPMARTPRISRLMALAIRIEKLACEGAMQSYRDLAEAGQISPSRMSQIRALTELAPSIQEELLFLPKIVSGREGIRESGLRKIARMMDWEAQTAAFRTLKEHVQAC